MNPVRLEFSYHGDGEANDKQDLHDDNCFSYGCTTREAVDVVAKAIYYHCCSTGGWVPFYTNRQHYLCGRPWLGSIVHICVFSVEAEATQQYIQTTTSCIIATL